MSEKITFIEPTYRRPDISEERFHYHWRAIHGPIGAAMANVGGYIQLHRVVPGLEGLIPLTCPGIVEAWFESEAAMLRTYDDPVYLEQAKPDNEHYVDIPRASRFFGTEEVVVAGDDEARNGVKALVLLERRADVEPEQFVAAWRAWSDAVTEAAAPIRATRCPVLAEGPGSTAGFDGIELLAWPTLAELEAAWSASVVPLLPQLAAFADLTGCAGWAGEEFLMK